MTAQECREILDRFKRWNHGQTSISLALHGIRTEEDDIYDERRRLIRAATKRLADMAEMHEDHKKCCSEEP